MPSRAARRPVSALALTSALTTAVLLTWAQPSAAQEPDEPIGRFVFDVRGAVLTYGQDPLVAANLNVPATTLPSRGLGVEVDGHWYPFRRARATLGLGTSVSFSSARWSPDAGSPAGLLPVDTRFLAVSPQISVNFGKADGWSYLSGGLGVSRLRVTRDRPVEPDVIIIGQLPEDPSMVPTINYGGGARWFARRHLAFCFDVRFYRISATPAAPPTRLFAINVGVGIK